MPLSAAFPIGGKTGIVGINIEIHYDNVHLIEGRTDSSGIRFHLTKTPLTHEVATLKQLLFSPKIPWDFVNMLHGTLDTQRD